MEFLQCVGGDPSVGRAWQWMRALVPLGAIFAIGCSGSQDPILGWDGEGPVQTRPQVTVTVPATATPAMTGVSTGTIVTAMFTKNMAPATINLLSFTVTGPGATAIPGTVTYASRTATFAPTFAFAGNSTFIATVTAAVTDASGNALSGNQAPFPAPSSYIWTFTTGPAALPSNLNLGIVQAFGQIQASADGSIRNDGVAGEPVPALTSTDAGRTLQVRHGFIIPPAL